MNSLDWFDDIWMRWRYICIYGILNGLNVLLGLFLCICFWNGFIIGNLILLLRCGFRLGDNILREIYFTTLSFMNISLLSNVFRLIILRWLPIHIVLIEHKKIIIYSIQWSQPFIKFIIHIVKVDFVFLFVFSLLNLKI